MINLVAACLALLAPSVQSEESNAGQALFERVVVTGASLSAGYGLRTELDAKADFGTVFAAALRSDDSKVISHGDVWFFQTPVTTAESLLKKTLDEKPTLVLALDYLFWFAFGPSNSEEARLDSLKLGLRLLDRVECPLVIADFPDMRLALKGTSPFGYALIQEHMLPAPETLEQLNAIVRAWSDERQRVTTVPLAEFFQEMSSETDVTLRGNEWKGSVTSEILQDDFLHPKLAGDLGLAVLVLDTLASATPEFCETCVLWSVPEIRARVMESTHDEREKNRERERKRAERKRKRDARKKQKEKSLSFTALASPITALY